MTNHWIDIRNSDVILIMGSNAAENHPISFKWVMKARQKGAKLISVDPRFTRTSAKSDIYAPIRSGADIAFLGGMIKYILDETLYDDYYVKNYTNAPFLVNTAFKMPGELDGVFSGYDPQKRSYDKKSWAFQEDADGVAKRDPSLSDPFSVFQLLKKHYSRYDVDTVSSITGTPREKLLEIYATYAASGAKGKSATIMYAMGWTQHTVGTQIIRTMAMIQLLLGNIGVAGGGVNALRGESNVQGSTDHCLLFHILPGYLKAPRASDTSLADYNEKATPKTKEPGSLNWWSNYAKYSVSLLKAHYGPSATKENEFGYAWLPKLDDGQNASWLMLFHEMLGGKFEGFFAWGQNPACSGSNAGKVRKALAALKWMVNVNVFDNETGSFWKGPGVESAEIMTEVFQLPCAVSVEKEGSITNSGRWAQWRYKAVDAPGDAKADSWIMNELYRRVARLYMTEGGAYPEPVTKLFWNYGHKGVDGFIHGEVDVHAIAREINGYYLEGPDAGKQVVNFTKLMDDGTTCSGNWLYSGSYTDAGNMMARRGTDDPTGTGLYPNWSWSWPVNRRIIYNRASLDDQGAPRAPERPVVWWNGSGWKGDVMDGGMPPTNLHAFIMKPHGVASIFGPGLADGPFPEHYEPLECPIQENPLSKAHRINPTAKLFYKMDAEGQPEADGGALDDLFATCDTRYPFVATTYRVTEHWQTGVMTRHQPWLQEMQPQNFVEMSIELGAELGLKGGEVVNVTSARGTVKAVAMVTGRFKPFKIMGSTVHQVGLPWCYGWQYPEDRSAFDSSNLLTPSIGDANTMIPETKSFMVNIEKA
jgi:formate dehydrogenase major subunit